MRNFSLAADAAGPIRRACAEINNLPCGHLRIPGAASLRKPASYLWHVPYFALSYTSLARYKQGNQQTKGQTPLQHCKCIYLNTTILKCINNCRATMFNVIVAEVKTKENHWTQFCIICLGLIWHENCTCLLLLIMLWCITLDRKHSLLFPILFSKNLLYIIQLDLKPYSLASTWRFPESTSQKHK